VGLIVPQRAELGVCSGDVARQINAGEGFHMAEDRLELGLKNGNLCIGQVQACELGHVANIYGDMGHLWKI
jgi:hypothetical protein